MFHVLVLALAQQSRGEKRANIRTLVDLAQDGSRKKEEITPGYTGEHDQIQDIVMSSNCLHANPWPPIKGK